MDKKVQQGTTPAPEKFKVVVSEKGPYLIYGQPPLAIETITVNNEGYSWDFRKGRSFPTTDQPTALCRCGNSKSKPYCDGAHIKAEWEPALTAPNHPLLEEAELLEGSQVSLSDNEKYCVFARFCDADGRAWNLVGVDGDNARQLTIREANMCPGGRLSAWNNKDRQPYEPEYEPSLGLIEDPTVRASAGLWVRGGITIERENGVPYEVRNRVVLCRCGQSANKPFCDGTHASMHFQDSL